MDAAPPSPWERIARWGIGAFIILVAAAGSWSFRFRLEPDAVSYLEVGEAFVRGDWAAAVNAYWSPLYAWLLGVATAVLRPSMGWEFPALHLVTFLLVPPVLASYNWFLGSVLSHLNRGHGSTRASGLPKPLVVAVGNLLLLWILIDFGYLHRLTPDLMVAGLLFLICGALLASDLAAIGARRAALLGALLALAYLTKLSMLAPAALFLAVIAWATREHPRRYRVWLAACLGFVVLAGPFVGALSVQKGRLTFGDKARLAYAWAVNDVEWYSHWQGEPASSGTPLHPTRRLQGPVPVYEFAQPVGGTYPVWLDPSYWYDGLTVTFSLRQQLGHVRSYIVPQLASILAEPRTAFVGAALALLAVGGLAMSRGRWRLPPNAALALLPALAALALYALVHVEKRYVGGHVMVISTVLLAATALPASGWRRRVTLGLGGVMLLAALAAAGWASWQIAGSVREELAGPRSGVSPSLHVRTAQALHAHGLSPGDRIGYIGESYWAFWARLAGLRVVAEIPYRDDRWKGRNLDRFELLDAADEQAVLELFRAAGAKAVVTSQLRPERLEGDWQRVEGTLLHLYRLEE